MIYLEKMKGLVDGGGATNRAERVNERDEEGAFQVAI